MGTRPVQSMSNNPLSVYIPRQMTDEERIARVNQIAGQMAQSFANQIVQRQREEPMPLSEKVTIGVVVTAALTIVVGVPAYLVTDAIFKYFGIQN